MRGSGRDRRHRGQGGAVEQTDDDQGQADRAESGSLLAGEPSDNRDANRLVEAARQCDAADRGGTAGGRERQRLRALAFSEEPLPAPGLEGIGEEEEDAGRDHQQRVGARERPARMDEMEHGQGRGREGARHEDCVQGDADAA